MEILDRRLRQNRDSMVPQVLVRWSDILVELATWEDEVPLRQEFPRALAWGQAGSKEGGDVTVATDAPMTGEAEEAPSVPKEACREADKRGRPRRALKTNSNVYGPDWLN